MPFSSPQLTHVGQKHHDKWALLDRRVWAPSPEKRGAAGENFILRGHSSRGISCRPCGLLFDPKIGPNLEAPVGAPIFSPVNLDGD